jgi:hypothetical protein
MAHVFIGNRSRVEREVLDAVSRLPDEFWVFAEFDVGRNVDWFVARAVPDERPPNAASTLIAMEVKRVSRPLRGLSSDAPWEIEDQPGTWMAVEPSNGDDRNYHWQAVNTANAVAQWLWHNQRLYREAADVRPQEEFGVWPDLLMLSPPGLSHRLPLGPTNRYGGWWYTADEWVNHVLGWRARSERIALTQTELSALADALRLERVQQAQPQNAAVVDDLGPELRGFVGWMAELSQRVRTLEARLSTLERNEHADRYRGAPARPASADRRPALQARTTPWTDEERRALVAAIEGVRAEGKSRAFPSIVALMQRDLGYSLRETEYNGFGTATAMFQQGLRDNILKFGPNSGPSPTIFLPEEPLS